jgi:hypothetical protein
MVSALRLALDTGGLQHLNWVLVIGLLVISLGLTFYLPTIEYNSPLRRLASEFNGITEGRQHELYHDTYGGELGKVARAATAAMEALRASWENELLDSDAEVGEGGARRTRSTRSLRAAPKGGPRRTRTRGHEAVEGGARSTGPTAAASADPIAIDLPSAADVVAPIERHASAEATVPSKPKPPPPPAPAFHDDVGPDLGPEDSSVSFADVGGQDREVYYRSIFDQFVETKIACGEPIEGFTYEKFAKKLRKQSDDLMARPDVADVQFSVYVKDGKAALRAKVVKA